MQKIVSPDPTPSGCPTSWSLDPLHFSDNSQSPPNKNKTKNKISSDIGLATLVPDLFM